MAFPCGTGPRVRTAGQAGKAPSQKRLLWPGRVSPAGGEEMPCPTSCPFVAGQEPLQPAQEITGAPRGRLGSPARGRPGGEEAIVGLCFSFPRLLELTKLPPPAAVQPPPAPPWGLAHQGPGLLKRQVQ